MSKKVLGIGLVFIGVALQAIPGIGQAIGLPLIAAGISTAAVIGLGLVVAGSFLLGPSKPKGLKTSNSDRLFASLDPTTPRKIVFGNTAMATDVRYQAFTGSSQEYLEQIIVVASHEVNSIDEIWLDNEKAWTSGGGAQGRYVGYLTVTARTLGTNANGIAIDSNWTTSCTLTGCAYVHMKYKTTGASKSAESPFSGGITSRMTIRGKGAKVYDPRLDSTVTGGSGSHRADDQTTWAWDADASRNPALQMLFYELGWKIGGKLAVGKGVPKARLDLASYGVAANVCDESVSLSGGGTEKRYRSDGVISEADGPGSVRDTLCATMNGVLRDSSGKLALTAIKNDLGSPVTPSGKSAFDEDDVLGEIRWDQTPDLSDIFNIVRGRLVDPSDSALYQLTEYPAISISSTDGIDRIDTFDLPMVQSNGQAQRLAKLRLKRNQYQGRLQFTGGPAFWALSLGDPFPLTHSAFGWTAKLLRCAGHSMNRGGSVQIVAVEENTAIYSWSAEDTAAVGAGTPVIYDPTNNPLVTGIDEAAITGGGYVQDDPPDKSISVEGTHWLDSGDSFRTYRRIAGTGVLQLDGADVMLDGDPVDLAWTEVAAGPDNTATNQVTIVRPVDQVFAADYLGVVPATSYPRIITPSVARGTSDLRTATTTTYSISAVGVTATVNSTLGSVDKGRITISSPATGWIDLTVSIDGVAQPVQRIKVSVVNADPPSGGAGTGGGTGNKSGSFGPADAITSTSYVKIGERITVTKGTGETIRAYAPSLGYSYYPASTGSKAASVKWRYATAGTGMASPTDFGSPVTGSASDNPTGMVGDATPGSVTCNQTAAPADGDYDVELWAALPTSGGTIVFDGTICSVAVGV